MVDPLRVVRPLTACLVEDEGDQVKVDKKSGPGSFWFTAPLLRNRRTQEAEQVPAKKLRLVEDLSENALPASTQVDAGMRGAKKFEQIGVSAALKLLEGLLDAEVPCDVGGVVLLDLACGVGDFFWAWLERRAREFQSACARCKATTYPLLYMGATADGTACEWLRHVQSDEVLQKLAHGSLALPGYQQKSQEPPADLLQAPPVPPQLNLCVMKGGSLVLPEAQTQQWASHGTFGPQFQEVMAEIVAEFGEPQAEEGPPRKRGAQDEQGGSGKRPKVAPTLDLRAVTSVAAGLAQAPVSGLKRDLAGKLVLRVCQDQSWWVMNMSEGKVSVAAGTTVAQFGHGAFKHVARGPEGQAGEADPQSVLFALNEDSDQVIHWGKLASV